VLIALDGALVSFDDEKSLEGKYRNINHQHYADESIEIGYPLG